MFKEDQTVFSKRITEWQAKRGYLKFPNKLQQQKYRTLLKKLIYRLKAGTLKVKQLEELKLKEELKAVTRFIERNIEKCYKTATK